jgi:hypothetical protein
MNYLNQNRTYGDWSVRQVWNHRYRQEGKQWETIHSCWDNAALMWDFRLLLWCSWGHKFSEILCYWVVCDWCLWTACQSHHQGFRMSLTNYSLMLHSIAEDIKHLLACRAVTEICMLSFYESYTHTLCKLFHKYCWHYCEIWNSYSSVAEDVSLVGCDVVSLGELCELGEWHITSKKTCVFSGRCQFHGNI